MNAHNWEPDAATRHNDIRSNYTEIDCRHWLQEPASAITNGDEQ